VLGVGAETGHFYLTMDSKWEGSPLPVVASPCLALLMLPWRGRRLDWTRPITPRQLAGKLFGVPVSSSPLYADQKKAAVAATVRARVAASGGKQIAVPCGVHLN
jgi:hypothetical protein